MNFERFAEEMCKEEYSSYWAYKYLAEMTSDEKLKKTLLRIAECEKRHYEFWKKFAKECKVSKPSRLKLKVLYKLFGPQFILKLFERDELSSIAMYKYILKEIKDEKIKKELEKIIKEEEKHELEFSKEVDDIRVKYMGYVALGLADAIVEVTGVHAGFLGATSNTVLAGLAGLVVGFSASLSMAGAAYIQAKHDPSVSPPVSAGVTGLSYLFSVVMLALPYFLIHDVLSAFLASFFIASLIMGIFIYYSSVIQMKNFIREYSETLGLLTLTSLGSYAFGYVVEKLLGIRLGA